MFALLAQLTPSPSPSATTASKGGPLTLLPLVLLVGLFYFFVMRPQRKVRANQAAMLSQLAVGDEIETTAGMFGRITKMTDTTLSVQLAPGFEVRMSRGAVRRKILPETIEPEG